MSINLMSAIFDLGALPPNPKLVLLKFADHANDQGLSCYPSVGRIACAASLSTRTVERIVARLREKRVLIALEAACGGRGKMGKGVSYRLDIARARELYAEPGPLGFWDDPAEPETPDKMSEVSSPSEPPTVAAKTPDSQDKNLRHQVADKPSEEPPEEPPGPPLGSPPHDGALFGMPDQETDNDHASKQPKRATRLDPDWQPPADAWAFGGGLGLTDAEVSDQLDRFRDHWTAESGQRATKRDWNAAFRNWLRKAPDFRGRGPGRAGGGHARAGRSEPPSVVAAVNRIRD